MTGRTFTKAGRNAYRDNRRCAICSSRVRITWDRVTTLADTQTQFAPTRVCTNRDCESNAGSIGDPAP